MVVQAGTKIPSMVAPKLVLAGAFSMVTQASQY